MNNMLKYGVFSIAAIIISFIFLKPIIMHENEYKVVIINTSERPVSSVTISGAGTKPNTIGPIRVGHMQDYFFIPPQDGELTYSIKQANQEFSGIINANLKKEEVGQKYIVVGELFKVKVFDEYDAAY